MSVVMRPAEGQAEMIVRVPAVGFQLVVGPNEVAAFTRDSKVLGVLATGRHVLQSDPSMTIAFVTLSPIAGQFGGPGGNGIMLFGNFQVRVVDPKAFIEAMVGMTGDGERVKKFVGDKVRTLLGSCLAEWMANGYFTPATASGAGPQLATAINSRLGELAEYGITATIEAVNVQVR